MTDIEKRGCIFSGIDLKYKAMTKETRTIAPDAAPAPREGGAVLFRAETALKPSGRPEAPGAGRLLPEGRPWG